MLIKGLTLYWQQLRSFSPNARFYLLSEIIAGLSFSVYMLIFNLYVVSRGYPRSFLGELQSLPQPDRPLWGGAGWGPGRPHRAQAGASPGQCRPDGRVLGHRPFAGAVVASPVDDHLRRLPLLVDGQRLAIYDGELDRRRAQRAV